MILLTEAGKRGLPCQILHCRETGEQAAPHLQTQGAQGKRGQLIWDSLESGLPFQETRKPGLTLTHGISPSQQVAPSGDVMSRLLNHSSFLSTEDEEMRETVQAGNPQGTCEHVTQWHRLQPPLPACSRSPDLGNKGQGSRRPEGCTDNRSSNHGSSGNQAT